VDTIVADQLNTTTKQENFINYRNKEIKKARVVGHICRYTGGPLSSIHSQGCTD